ncbi:hypothetical protein QBC41DRAFT_341314 [Cercophora samala]|uniref:Uncharacterized protein n=1 Tax=Cercophora samala TaxID=330535 RepID=A0AA39YW61_9PEZI|nr:hypothetical protein QBC41DRAFT_341314 [Cercophora samala]
MLAIVTYLAGILALCGAFHSAPSVLADSVAPRQESDHIYQWTCGLHRKAAIKYRVQEGIDYLHKLSGTPENGANSCGRVSCSYDAAIIWCNNTTEPMKTTWEKIAKGAQFLVDHCPTEDDRGVEGRARYSDHWEVRVYADSC